MDLEVEPRIPRAPGVPRQHIIAALAVYSCGWGREVRRLVPHRREDHKGMSARVHPPRDRLAVSPFLLTKGSKGWNVTARERAHEQLGETPRGEPKLFELLQRPPAVRREVRACGHDEQCNSKLRKPFCQLANGFQSLVTPPRRDERVVNVEDDSRVVHPARRNAGFDLLQQRQCSWLKGGCSFVRNGRSVCGEATPSACWASRDCRSVMSAWLPAHCVVYFILNFAASKPPRVCRGVGGGGWYHRCHQRFQYQEQKRRSLVS